MGQRSLWREELRRAKADRGEGDSGVKLYDRRGVEQGSERHGRARPLIIRRLERATGA
jgi:hypothetical protein